ncbi:MAG: ribonuclease P protein component 1 [Candidatus Thorarchaeota archaeon]|nr:MAG: ribonuclease P protein subunit [Candidatus Thorarchaeota archaeon]RLI58620.1 MAG: ribonuclease P protein subunit [Candidatus Thorarchaeota archaeon]
MKVTPQNIVNHELVGLTAHVVKSSHQGYVCKQGVIIDESKETLSFDTRTGRVVIPKSVCVFDVRLPNGPTVRIQGDLLRGRPEDRLKKRLNRRW